VYVCDCDGLVNSATSRCYFLLLDHNRLHNFFIPRTTRISRSSSSSPFACVWWNLKNSSRASTVSTQNCDRITFYFYDYFICSRASSRSLLLFCVIKSNHFPSRRLEMRRSKGSTHERNVYSIYKLCIIYYL
jgi:hypothetical protein